MGEDDRDGAGALLGVSAGLSGGPEGAGAGTAAWTDVGGGGVHRSLVPRGAPAVAVADPTGEGWWERGETVPAAGVARRRAVAASPVHSPGPARTTRRTSPMLVAWLLRLLRR